MVELLEKQKFISLDLQVVSERSVALNVGSSYILRCHNGTDPGVWTTTSGVAIGSGEPQDETATAVYQYLEDNKQVLGLQNFAASLDGEYTCSAAAGGEQKILRIFASTYA